MLRLYWPTCLGAIAKLLRFGAVGLLCTLVYLGVMLGMTQVAFLPTLANHVLAFGAALPISYFLQKEFTFHHVGPHRHSLPRFVVANGLAFLASSVGVALAKERFALGEFAIMGLVVVIIPAMNFLTMALWVFIDPLRRGIPAPRR